MMFLAIVLAALLAWLWRDVQRLRVRLELLEASGASGFAFTTPNGGTAAAWAEPLPADSDCEPAPDLPLKREQPAADVRTADFALSPIDLGSSGSNDLFVSAGDFEVETEAPRPGFEEIFGRRLPIWAGGMTLAVAGFLIVKHSIEAGLLSPLVRVMLGLLFGGALIVAAEAALRAKAAVRDPRVWQALSGAGVATLYATTLAAANLYQLISPGAAFAGMAAATALAAGLSVRFGAPSAVLGLIGGLAAPALVGSAEPNMPLLTLYLALAVGGLCALGRRQRWWWLGAGALAGGFGWDMLLVVAGALDAAETLSIGIYTLGLAVGLPLLLVGSRAGLVRLASAAAGCAQLAVLVATGGFAPLHWALFGLLSILILWLSRRDRSFADVPALALGVAILLAIAWPGPSPVELIVLMMAMVAIYAAPAILRVWREDMRLTDAPSIAAVVLAIGVLPIVHDQAMAAAVALAGAAVAGGAAALGWRVSSRLDDARFSILAIAAATLLALAGLQTLDVWAYAPLAALLALGLRLLADRAGDPRVGRGAWAYAIGTILLLLADTGLTRLWGEGEAGGFTAVTTWAIPAAVAACFAWRAYARLTPALQAAAVMTGYGAAAQCLPGAYLPLIPVLLGLGLASTRREAALPCVATAVLIASGWAAMPLLNWTVDGAISLAGAFIPRAGWPTLGDAVVRIALPALAIGLGTMLMPLRAKVREVALAAAGVGVLVTLHVLVKQAAAMDTTADFQRLGMAARTIWEMLLAVIALLAWRLGASRAMVALGAASLAHFAWFTVLVHNPLFVEQHVGLWLASAYAMAGLLLWGGVRTLPELRRALAVGAMALIVVSAFTLLRQVASADMLLGAGTGEIEDIARSILAIVLAVGFLWVGIARQARDWRIASLLLMLAAAAKVFLLDAAGLDGIARIGSFAALGFSLIGIGWLYSRYLPDQGR